LRFFPAHCASAGSCVTDNILYLFGDHAQKGVEAETVAGKFDSDKHEMI
jgi:hypothetical protein